MMKIYIFLLFSTVFCYSVLAENCVNINDCILTQCIQTTVHSHIACDKGHCTCKEDAKPCISIQDCNMGARCIGSSGQRDKFHCLDSTCQCI
ncbi:serine protease inhibitor Cvsi-2-like [Mercenaria mercenaria]|uniref:serine protease inhibitor Cvsi-2-like n=1 Tax=Mercenaria mercenaria TaxID=6596 RepID=UPI00234F7312|nr:serine protease inhibitor Cvsi-2-like [Mercenaria mercenaria]